MNIWRSARRESGGAWRSLQFDLHRRATRHDSTDVLPTVDDPTAAYPTDVGDPPSPYEAFAGRMRRMPTAVAVAVLVVAGTAGTYIAVVGGLSLLVVDESPAPGALPAVSHQARPGVRPPMIARPSRAATATATATTGAPTSAAPAVPALAVGAPGPAPRRSAEAPPRRGVPVPKPAPTCGCPHPPEPSPSTQPPPSPTPSPTPTPSASPSPTPTAEPSEQPPGDSGS